MNLTDIDREDASWIDVDRDCVHLEGVGVNGAKYSDSPCRHLISYR
jgi:hypothetical protein